jgi:hypothetical protein
MPAFNWTKGDWPLNFHPAFSSVAMKGFSGSFTTTVL